MENKPENTSGISTSPSQVDPETGQVTWDVKYEANYALIYKTFKILVNEYKNSLHLMRLKRSKI